jgi:hypothetical protein
MKNLFSRLFGWTKGVRVEGEALNAGKLSVGGKLMGGLNAIMDIYAAGALIAWGWDKLFGESKSEKLRLESVSRLIFDPIVLLALTAEHRQDVIQTMLSNRAMVYLLHGNVGQYLFGTSLATASSYIEKVDSRNDTFFDKESAKSIIHDGKSTEIASLINLDEIEKWLDQPDVDTLQSFKLIDYLAYFINLNGSDFKTLPIKLNKIEV